MVTTALPSLRLPILQGGTFAFVAPSLAMLSLPAWKCPEWTLNASQVNTSSPEFTEEWQKRIREVTGELAAKSMHLRDVSYPTPRKRDDLHNPQTQQGSMWNAEGAGNGGWGVRMRVRASWEGEKKTLQ